MEELGTYIRNSWQRKSLGVMDQWGLGLEEWEMNRGLEGMDWRMSQWSCSWSMITVAQRMGSANLVACSKLVSYSLVNTGQDKDC